MYTVRIYSTGQAIGTANITAEQFRHYEAMAQQPEGIIRLGALPMDFYDLEGEFQGTGEETSVYLD